VVNYASSEEDAVMMSAWIMAAQLIMLPIAGIGRKPILLFTSLEPFAI
jgi:hypothetical protein